MDLAAQAPTSALSELLTVCFVTSTCQGNQPPHSARYYCQTVHRPWKRDRKRLTLLTHKNVF